jgi:hypothetical protein
VQNNLSTSIHIVLKDLIEAKSKRDNIKFTSYQLANELSMPRSIITKLTHPDKTKRISNPRIETLIKIVDFFKKDGFDITIDDLLRAKKKPIDIQALQVTKSSQLLTTAIYSLVNTDMMLGTIEIELSQAANNVIALYTENDIAPFFKSGTVFIINSDLKPEHNNLIALQTDHTKQVHIKRYVEENNKKKLKSLEEGQEDIVLMPTQSYKILGVIIQVNAKT